MCGPACSHSESLSVPPQIRVWHLPALAERSELVGKCPQAVSCPGQGGGRSARPPSVPSPVPNRGPREFARCGVPMLASDEGGSDANWGLSVGWKDGAEKK